MTRRVYLAYATITGIYLYPVKSCRGIALERATVGPAGLEGDRRWLVVTETGRFLSQRKLPRLALVAPELTREALTLRAPGMPTLDVTHEVGGPRVEVTVLSDRCAALDTGDDAAGWLSRFLGQPVRLVRFDPNGGRRTNPAWGGASDPIEFSDGFPLMVISEASLDDLNRRLEVPLPMNRFRPNIVLAGVEAYGEDRVHALVDGSVRLRMVWPCPRCKITTTDQSTGMVAGPEPLVMLRSYRSSDQVPGVLFGHYALVAGGIGSEVRLGQRLAIEWKETEERDRHVALPA